MLETVVLLDIFYIIICNGFFFQDYLIKVFKKEHFYFEQMLLFFYS